MFDDLQQMFGYRGAIDERTGASIVGPELLVVPCWTPEFCATLIRAAEAIGAFEHQPDDPVPGHEVSLAIISPRLFETVQDDFGSRIWPQLQMVWPYVDYHGLRDAFVIRYAPGEQESLRIHHDVAQVSGSIKLNEGYSGAALVFPRQAFDNSSVAVGEMLVWPSLVTHPHETAQLERGVKYALTVWFELPSF
ncbi:MAG TPA: hypothetical protein VHQ23_16930 [Ilumatobacteraceae bacterium]|jgi:hypothetical protein|nr:hypothetical protein [Ilumatobacteraceae bacterium]